MQKTHRLSERVGWKFLIQGSESDLRIRPLGAAETAAAETAGGDREGRHQELSLKPIRKSYLYFVRKSSVAAGDGAIAFENETKNSRGFSRIAEEQPERWF